MPQLAKRVYGSSREFVESGQSRSLQGGREYLAQKTIIPHTKNHRLVEVQHVVVWVRGAIIHGKRRYGKAVGRLITQDVLP